MRCAAKETCQDAFVKRRCHNGNVVQVASAFPRIVGDIDVAFKDVLAPDAADKVTYCVCHRIDVAGGACDGLRQHLAARVINASG